MTVFRDGERILEEPHLTEVPELVGTPVIKEEHNVDDPRKSSFFNADDQIDEEYNFNEVENSLETALPVLLAEDSAGPEEADLYLLDQHISAEDKQSPIVNL